jgi:putative membrane protein
LQLASGEEATMRRTGIVLALVLVSGIARAQTSAHPGSKPAQGSAALSKSDQQFAMQAAAGGLAEVQLSQLAMNRAESLVVKQFARKMVEDHSKANMELQQIAAKQNLKLPDTLDRKHQETYDKLSQLSGAEFDREYMKAMAQSHDATVAKFKDQSVNGQDPELKAFAMRTLPVIEKHDRMAHVDIAKVKDE